MKSTHHFEVASVVLGVLSYGCDSLLFFWLKNVQEFGNKMMVYECYRRTLYTKIYTWNTSNLLVIPFPCVSLNKFRFMSELKWHYLSFP